MNKTLNKYKPIKIRQCAKPFLKWAGGKAQLLEKFEAIYPKELKIGEIKNYYEPFVGGGAVFFDIVQNYSIENVFIYDISEELILIYKVIQKNVPGLLIQLYTHEKHYLGLDKEERKKYFYNIREIYNSEKQTINYSNYQENWIRRAGQAIFLNKTCYNGLFRFNNNGGFNTPAGKYVNPKICNEANLLLVSEVLQKATIKCAGFEEMISDIQENSFVYFDPPYRPISKTANFTSYSKQLFTDNDQIKLANFFATLNQRGCKLMLSNSDPKNSNPADNFFDTLYSDFTIKRIPARRNINSAGAKRGNINEIIVTNY